MAQSQSNQRQWFSKYKTISQEVEKTGQYQPLIEWYDQNHEIFEGGTYAAKKCCQLLHQYIGNSSNLAILDLGCGTGDQGRILSEMGFKNLEFRMHEFRITSPLKRN
ncbi:class I SAM-dependent methyltransferase [Okeania sp. KiyG1]|uniref:class I SAM-dependent methyltransferase n=1 Tax=Okeania sp. KiyG1 TaxID=2720165 RepID=UPI00192340E3|nr:class I SAM-dependent methyltransferase [Okeania sp. KiyG1]GGA07772.1 hypothetical protein CYANOKiyG1_20220 [Okeania sp. KiyG1]